MLLVFCVLLVTNAGLGAESPIPFLVKSSDVNLRELSRGNFANLAIGSQVGIGILCEISSDVVIVDVECFSREKNEGREICGPPDSVLP